jgi:hypothetical protein
MRRQATRLLAATLLGGMALAAAGCDSKGSPKATGSGAAPGSSTAVTTTSATSTTASGTVKPHLGVLTSKNCTQLYNLAQSFSSALTGAGDDLDKTVVVLQKFAAQSPAEIRPDFQVLADASAKIATALNELNLGATAVPTSQVIQRMAKLSDEIDMTKVSAASSHIGTWASKNCQNFVLDTLQP